MPAYLKFTHTDGSDHNKFLRNKLKKIERKYSIYYCKSIILLLLIMLISVNRSSVRMK